MYKNMLGLIKFSKERYINELYENGTVFMRRLSDYQKIEQDEIGDKNEGVSHLYQNSQIKKMSINGQEIEPINVKIKLSNSPNPFIFCTFALTQDIFINNKNNIDKRNLKFGNTALLIQDYKEFIKRIKKNINTAFRVETYLIKYIDNNLYSGEMGEFNKFDDYKHQNEFRIALYSNNYKENILKLNIGSIKDISKIFKSENILNTMIIE